MSQRPGPSGRHRREAPGPAATDPENGSGRDKVSRTRRASRTVKRRVVRPVFGNQTQAVTAGSDDGVVTFTLIPCEGGVLHVERVQRQLGARPFVQSMEFRDGDSFARWCESDRLQFVYPLLYANLRRRARGLFNPNA